MSTTYAMPSSMPTTSTTTTTNVHLWTTTMLMWKIIQQYCK